MPPFLFWAEMSDPSKAGFLCLTDASKSATERYLGSGALTPGRLSGPVRRPLAHRAGLTTRLTLIVPARALAWARS